MQIPLTKYTRDIVFINTSTKAQKVPKSVLDELHAESTNIESSNANHRYFKRSKQLSKVYLAAYVSKIIILKAQGLSQYNNEAYSYPKIQKEETL